MASLAFEKLFQAVGRMKLTMIALISGCVCNCLLYTSPLQDWLEDDPDAEAHAALLDLYFEVQDILRASERYDEHFAAQLTARGSDLELQLLCLDPIVPADLQLSCK